MHVPKTAGSTFQFVLENTFGISHCHTFQIRKPVFDRQDFLFARKIFPWMRSLGGGNIIDPLELGAPDPFYMTLLREPIARAFSHYQHLARMGHKKSFEEMLRAKGVLSNLQVKWISGGTDLNKAKFFLEKCGFVGLTEKFDLSLEALGRLSPYPLNLSYERRQIAPDNTIKKRLESDPRIVELAREYNQLDLELYSFAKREIFPKLCQKAGLNPSATAASHETPTKSTSLNYRLGRWYNRIFRQLTKIRPRRSFVCANRFSDDLMP
ncbi:MAG: hypothetical protein ACTHKU_12800 [Verrucomicrobiota bacterium]